MSGWMTAALLGVISMAGLVHGSEAELLRRYHRASSIGLRGYGEPEPRPPTAPGPKHYAGRPRLDFGPGQPRLEGPEGLASLLGAFRRAGVPLVEARERWLRGEASAEVLRLAALGRVLFAGAGVTKVERFGGRVFYYRAAPSAGALYPVELYAAAARVEGLEPGLYHYDPLRHELEVVRTGAVWEEVRAALGASEAHSRPACYLVLSGVFDRTRVKYNVRAYRYVLLDAGHTAANLTLEGAATGLRVRLLPHFEDGRLNRALGLDGRREAALLVLALETAGPQGRSRAETPRAGRTPPTAAGPPAGPSSGPLSLRAHAETRLGADGLAHLRSPEPAREAPSAEAELTALPAPARPRGTLEEALCGRRSRRRPARRSLSKEQLSTLLAWSARGVRVPGLRFYVVVRRVAGVEPGVYRYRPGGNALERAAPQPSREELSFAAAGQGWVAASACVVVPVAEAEQLRGPLGARWYRDVHLEAGQAGERLYLAAEGLGLGTCAVGAFRDEAVARLLGLREGLWPLILYPVAGR